MNLTYEDLLNDLKKKKIRLSHQRFKVLEYLSKNRIHPNVDQIYSKLHAEVPTLSKTTIYNTLNTLIKANLVRVITSEENEARYDINTENHGHFKCEACGTIYDFEINIDCLAAGDLENFKITEKNVYFKGICPGCLSEYKS